MGKAIISIFFIVVAPLTLAVELYDNFPDEIHPDERYVFYSHGQIVEGTDPRPVHPQFGVYEFHLITQKLFDNGGFNLIAHQRPKNTNSDEYSKKLAGWVEKLIGAGVRPEDITLVGFSKGSQITLKASNRLNQTGISTAVMAVCTDGDFSADPPIELAGHVLSIFETSDRFNSCGDILGRSEHAKSTKEIAISTGLRHGAFYTPQPEWMNPLKEWLKDNDH